MDNVWQIAKENGRKIFSPNKSSVSLLIKLISSCRSRCKYCLSWKTPKDFLPYSSLNGLLKELDAFASTRITFSGGEPTTHPDFVKIISQAKRNCDNVAVITDGQFSNNKDWFQFVDELIFSIDTTNPIDYKFIRGINGLKKAVDNLQEAIKLGKKTSVNIVLSRIAIRNLRNTVRDFIKLGVSNIYFLELETHLNISRELIPNQVDTHSLNEDIIPFLKSTYGDVIHVDDNAQITYDSRKESKISCLIPWMHITIRPNGNIFPCCRIGDDNPDGNDLSYCLGNLRDLKLIDLWTSDTRRKTIDLIMNEPPLPCKSCAIGASFDDMGIWDNIESIRM